MRVYTYMSIMAGLMVLFTFFGLGTGTSLILSYSGLLENPQGFAGSTFYAAMSAVFALAAVGSFIIGLFTKSSTESFQLAAMSAILGSFIFDIVNILTYTSIITGSKTNWIYMAVAIILIPFIIGYIVSILEWWRGAD